MKTVVYIAGPYTKPDLAINTRIAILKGQELRDKFDIITIAPHFSHFEHLLSPKDYEYWLQMDFDLLKLCDILYRLPGESSGADREIDFALANGIAVVYSDEELKWLI